MGVLADATSLRGALLATAAAPLLATTGFAILALGRL